VQPPELVTARLVLDRLSRRDVNAFLSYRSRPEVCRYQSFEPSDVRDAAHFIESLEQVEWGVPGTWFQLAVRERGSRTIIGDLGVHFLDEDQAEIGITVDPAYQRTGVATEAVTAVLEHLFEVMGMHRIVASVDPRNEASVALFERTGMRREAHFRQSIRFKGEWADDLVFAVLASEWPAPGA
jgi:RimJ/RimL family protein N-acetyltransferase